MPYFFRAIYNNTKWDKSQFPTWLAEGDLPACIVRDLRADDNALSLWGIPDGEDNLPQVIAALASTRKILKDDFDYALLNISHVDQVNFICLSENGTTPYVDINSCHRSLANLSTQKLVYFAHLLSQFGIFHRTGWKELRSLLLDAVNGNKLNLSKIPKELKQQLGIDDAKMA